jgi:hypothetical protein
MKKRILTLALAAGLAIAAAGCARMSVRQEARERVDIEVSGNQGVIYGPVPAPHRVDNDKRDIIAVDVELPMYHEVESAIKKEVVEVPSPTADRGSSGNAGVVSQKAKKIK